MECKRLRFSINLRIRTVHLPYDCEIRCTCHAEMMRMPFLTCVYRTQQQENVAALQLRGGTKKANRIMGSLNSLSVFVIAMWLVDSISTSSQQGEQV